MDEEEVKLGGRKAAPNLIRPPFGAASSFSPFKSPHTIKGLSEAFRHVITTYEGGQRHTWKKKFQMSFRTVVVGILILLFTRNLVVTFHTTLF